MKSEFRLQVMKSGYIESKPKGEDKELLLPAGIQLQNEQSQPKKGKQKEMLYPIGINPK